MLIILKINGISFVGFLLILEGYRHRDIDMGGEMAAIRGS